MTPTASPDAGAPRTTAHLALHAQPAAPSRPASPAKTGGSSALLANLAMLGGLGIFGLGVLLFALYWFRGDPDLHKLAGYAMLAGAFIEVAVIMRALVLKALRDAARRAG